MTKTYADNAIAAKVRSLYGKRLGEQDYRQLLQKRTIGEIAAYLKHETAYRSSLGEVREGLIHRGQLEALVRKRAVDIQERLMKYQHGDNLYFQTLALERETDQLLLALRMLSTGSMDRYITTFPAYLDKYLTFDLFRLAHSKHYDDLLDAVEHSDYYRILGPFRPVGGNPINLPGCERALLAHLYGEAMDLVAKQSRGEVRETLTNILRARIDLHNVMAIYRLKRFFSGSPDMVEDRLIPIKGRIAPRVYRRLIEAEDVGAFREEIQSLHRLGRMIQQAPGDMQMEWTLEKMIQDICRKAFRFSTHPVVVLMSYMFLLEMEIHNIVNIIEGTRYHTPAEEIRKLLIL